MNGKRLVVAVFGLVTAAIAAYTAYRFIAAMTVATFLYYSTRRFHAWLKRFRLPERIRAVLTLSVLGVPLLGLLSYTIILLAVEARRIVMEYPVFEAAPDEVAWFQGLDELPDLTLDGILSAYRAGELDVILDFLVEHAAFLTGVITSFLLNLFVVVVVTYYLLIDGSRARDWLLRFDDDSIVRAYLEAADEELEAVLFGNLLNVIVISVLAVGVFVGYNQFAPAPVQVPYPALAGALTGVASLIPVVGMKIVYIPLAAAASAPAVLSGETSLLVYIVGFLALAVVVVDTIPDILLRPFLSGNRTHVGLLLLAYIFGPIVFGFYGLFFAPIILVLVLTFADTALPRLLGGDPEQRIPNDQRRIDEYL